MKATHRLIVHGIMKVDNKILVTKRTLEEDGRKNTFGRFYDVPGGSVDEGETPKIALVRETKEETNLDVEVGKIIYEDSEYDEEKNIVFTRLTYICNIVNFNEIKLDENEHDEYKLVDNIADFEEDEVVPFLKEVLGNREKYGI